MVESLEKKDIEQINWNAIGFGLFEITSSKWTIQAPEPFKYTVELERAIEL